MTSLDAVLDVRTDDFRLDVTVTAAPGEVLAVLGPSGAGKTTLLRSLAGLRRLTRGHVRLGDAVLASDTAHVPVHERRVALLFQDHRLFPHLSARDNIAFGPRSRGAGRRAAQAMADRWLAAMDLTGLGDRRPPQLSGGQAQRVALARALAAEPDLLLLDEPLTALDAGTRASVRSELRRHLAGFAGPALLVTHDPLEAMTLADRLLVLEDGVAVQTGTPAEVARSPLTSYVGQLVGLNVLTGTAVAGLLTTGDGTTVRLAGEVSGEVVATISPAAVTLHTTRPDATSARNLWRCTVEALEPFGDRVRAVLGGEVRLLADVTLLSVAELRLAPGTAVWASVKAVEVGLGSDP